MTKKPSTRESARSKDSYQAALQLLVAAAVKTGIPDAELARRLERPQSYVQKCFAGIRRVDFVELVELCAALEIDPIVIMQKTQRLVKKRNRSQ